jgi:tryptophan halogenase
MMTIAGKRRIGVIGGGSAGYLAALALRTQCPELEVTLIESSKQPTIGVGEGTTPVMLPFLHGYLGLDFAELISELQPTWKIGVSLDWGPKRGKPFQFPFSALYLTDSVCADGYDQ